MIDDLKTGSFIENRKRILTDIDLPITDKTSGVAASGQSCALTIRQIHSSRRTPMVLLKRYFGAVSLYAVMALNRFDNYYHD
jgi:hypothetical protein